MSQYDLTVRFVTADAIITQRVDFVNCVSIICQILKKIHFLQIICY